MLLLTRRMGEKIIINGNIEITVCSVKGSTVKIGIEAPKDVEVHREEIHERILQGLPPKSKEPKEVAPSH